jgi:hypothetical protein
MASWIFGKLPSQAALVKKRDSSVTGGGIGAAKYEEENVREQGREGEEGWGMRGKGGAMRVRGEGDEG